MRVIGVRIIISFGAGSAFAVIHAAPNHQGNAFFANYVLVSLLDKENGESA